VAGKRAHVRTLQRPLGRFDARTDWNIKPAVLRIRDTEPGALLPLLNLRSVFEG